MLAFVGQASVELVAYDGEVVSGRDFGHGFETGAVHRCARGVGGVSEEERFRVLGDTFGHVSGEQAEFVLGAGGDGTEAALGQGDGGLVGDVAGVGAEDFVAVVDERAEGDVEGLTGAAGNDDLGGGVVGNAVERVQLLTEGFAELHEAVVGGVVRLALLDALDGGAADGFGGYIIGFTDAEGDNVVDGAEQVEELADAAGGHGGEAPRDEAFGSGGIVFHGPVPSAPRR